MFEISLLVIAALVVVVLALSLAVLFRRENDRDNAEVSDLQARIERLRADNDRLIDLLQDTSAYALASNVVTLMRIAASLGFRPQVEKGEDGGVHIVANFPHGGFKLLLFIIQGEQVFANSAEGRIAVPLEDGLIDPHGLNQLLGFNKQHQDYSEEE
ncbi:MAG: hypothetical protein HC892_00330 [Saprospiraceae bacterium]|nr:hypothetical protein [Saprospiraceae bacterium]